MQNPCHEATQRETIPLAESTVLFAAPYKSAACANQGGLA